MIIDTYFTGLQRLPMPVRIIIHFMFAPITALIIVTLFLKYLR